MPRRSSARWHLGHLKPFLPLQHGFDEYFGLPYANDMMPGQLPHTKLLHELPLIEGNDVVQRNPDQSQLTKWYTERAVGLIERNRDRPFFLSVPHAMPHVPIFASAEFKGRTPGGLYGDVIAEIDRSVGRISR